MSCFGLSSPARSADYLHKKSALLSSGKLISGEAPIFSDSIFFGDKTTTSSSLDKSKEDEVFNMHMIENAYYIKNKNYSYTSSPIINQKDKANITALIYAQELQKRINKEYSDLKENTVMHKSDYQIKGNLILTELIVKEFTAVAPSDINSCQWANENPLTSAMLSCIKDNHEQPDINATVSDRAIRFLCTKVPNEMNEIFSLDGFISTCVDEITQYLFSPEGNNMTSTNDIAASIKRKVKKIASDACIYPDVKIAELREFNEFIKQFP
ncbi:hypothetical protein [Yersinia mollaretii]|uniref:hypothetical protein n=1 Tax=Yersinia mollaretii TaxID=33060 RepID=UPI0005EA1B41|nr:hypothetical protein [Yersinia mollaretii]MDA5528870.1 hypothetical protein [Yersinia mollaretii]MDR7875341.1 hypothetical protein [Yersinia mollaretii]WQC76489.1 hypothetical protein U1Z61_08375 [Yersinia mollaretii]CNF56950.1 Uncharacterised protein [Yersinia mollaretii]CQJ31203.1 Uncharacterised protein [Yersinia mollaretii]